MLHTDNLKLFQPLNSAAPQAAHMFHELRSLGYSLVMGWGNGPYAVGDVTIYDVMLTAAGDGVENGTRTLVSRFAQRTVAANVKA